MDATPGSIRVLHVDDDPDLARLVGTFLEREDDRFAVETATSVSGGLDRLDAESFDCVVSDYDMPDMDGIEFLERVREEYPDVPFILFTGKGSEEVASEALSAGATDYLQKETGHSQYAVLANRVSNAVAQYRAELQSRERKRKLEEQRQLYSTLVEQSPNGVMIVQEREVAFVNLPMEELTGLSESDLIGRPFYEIMAPEYRDLVERRYEQRIRGERPPRNYEIEIETATEERRTIDLHVSRIQYRGEPATLATFNDITEHKERERELEAQRAFVEQAVNALDDVFYVVETDGTLRRWNDRMAEVTGYTDDELDGIAATELFTEEDRERVGAAIEETLTTGRAALEAALLTADGERIPYEFTGGRLTDHEGELIGLVGVGRDLTERKRRQREREATIDLLRELYDVTVDPDRSFEEKVHHLLETGCERLGLPYGFLTRIDSEDGDDATQYIVEATGAHEDLQPGESCPLSEAYCRKTLGTEGLLAIQDAVGAGWEDDPAYERFELGCYVGAKVLVDGELYGTLCFASTEPRAEPFTDLDRMLVRLMSKWVSYELERRRATRELRRQNERLAEFASVVSHDLRNPLNVATNRLELAREEYDSEHLDAVERAHGRMEALIDDILTLARQGDQVRDPEPVGLARLAESCWRNVDTSGAALVVDTDRTVQADRGRLQQLLENLVRNSVEHGSTGNRTEADDLDEHGGETERDDAAVTVTVGDLDDGFYVADDGPGIPEDEREEVFDAGYTTASDGTGFGLSIVEQVADAHGWELRVTESAEGGARFEITGTDDPLD